MRYEDIVSPSSWGYILAQENPADGPSRGCRKPLGSVLSKCVVCRRFNPKNIETVPPPLPEDRVRDAAVFQITGVDMADLEEQRQGDNAPHPSDLRDIFKGKLSLDEMKDIGVPNITRTSRHLKILKSSTL
ncbi:hypothetical protein CEXT_316481 [Caerostris extrusa]|uniref:Uncharacterized protein n=1 Tax=Caerostris extrusa TaxID=172846 RepID=A0AAV4VL79_CAEEX|nr:hypothetical protein CEXT_316481 [Caerostris extrusa]